MRDPQPKGKKNVSLSDEVLLRRLEPIGLDPVKIDLSRSELNQMVTRLFMSAVYGGSMQATFPKVSKRKFDQNGKDDFMYLHLDYHPFAPQTPGGCGLWFSTEEEDPENGFEGVKRVFTRDWKRAIWQYMGQYKVKPAQSLTLDEWLDQLDKVMCYYIFWHCFKLTFVGKKNLGKGDLYKTMGRGCMCKDSSPKGDSRAD